VGVVVAGHINERLVGAGDQVLEVVEGQVAAGQDEVGSKLVQRPTVERFFDLVRHGENARQNGLKIGCKSPRPSDECAIIIEQMFDCFEQGLAALAEQDLGPVDPVDLGSDIKRISSVLNRLEAQRARRIEQFDRYNGFGPSGDTSTTSWLRNNCQLSGFAADKHVKLARQLPELQATQQALETGEIGAER